MPRSRQWRVRTCDLFPGILLDVVDHEIVEELRGRSVEILASEQEDLILVCWIGNEGA